MEKLREPVVVDDVLPNPGLVRTLAERNAPYWPVQRYFANATEMAALSDAPAGSPRARAGGRGPLTSNGSPRLKTAPRRTHAAARFTTSGVMKLIVPRSSSFPQRPQLETFSATARRRSMRGGVPCAAARCQDQDESGT